MLLQEKRKYFVSTYRGEGVKIGTPPHIAPVSKNSLAGYFGKSILWYL